MRRRAKYKIAGSGRKQWPLWVWLLAGCCIGLTGFFVWNWKNSPGPKRAQKQPTQSRGAQVERQSARHEPAGPPTNAPVQRQETLVQTNQPAIVQTNHPESQLLRTNALVVPSDNYPKLAETPLEVQVALARRNLSPGSVDGVMGWQTRVALRVFQTREGLSPTGYLDPATKARLHLSRPPSMQYQLTQADLARLRPLSSTWLGKSLQPFLEFESLPELLGERSKSSPTLIRRLNPYFTWPDARTGSIVQIPDTSSDEPRTKAATITIRLGDRALQAFGQRGELVAHFPCSIAKQVSKRPRGELRVQVIVPDPNYTFDPRVFPESEEGRRLKRKLVLPPGPNNPVGVVWIGLDKPGYGIHGTPLPEQVGRTESHGCFRLANWNAQLLMKLAWVGMPVRVEP